MQTAFWLKWGQAHQNLISDLKPLGQLCWLIRGLLMLLAVAIQTRSSGRRALMGAAWTTTEVRHHTTGQYMCCDPNCLFCQCLKNADKSQGPKDSLHHVFIVKCQLFRPGNLVGSSQLEALAAQLMAVKLTSHLCAECIHSMITSCLFCRA